MRLVFLLLAIPWTALGQPPGPPGDIHGAVVDAGFPSCVRPVADVDAADSPNIEGVREKLAKQLEALRQKDHFPGGTAAAVLADGTVISVSAGVSDAEEHTPMKPTDRMLAGSIGKTYFAAILMNLLHDHKLELDEKIEKYIGTEPWFNRLPNAKQITIHMLMNHTSGIPEHVESPEFTAAILKNPDKVWTPVETLSFVFDKPALFPAGTKWSYADTNFILLAYIAEKITGKRMYDLIAKDILKPLGLSDTIPSTSRTLPGLIPGYSMPGSPFSFEGRTIRDGKFVINPQFEWAGGGFVSTSADLARWAKDLYECKAFPREMLGVMLQSVPAWTGPGDKYGLGVQIRQTEFGETYGHGGWFPGYLSEMEYFPEYRVAIAVQVNTDHFDQPAGKTHSYIVALAKEIFPGKPAVATSAPVK
jgi:D-alanyl-D-alanine carboxypeptidase